MGNSHPPRKARLIGTGSYLPERVLKNEDFEKIIDTSDEWIVTRTGMKERRIAGINEFPSDMGYEAAKKALEAAHMTSDHLDLIVVATMTPDYISPSTGAIIQAKLGCQQIPALDIQAACTGYLYGLSMAKAYIESGMYQNILVIASEKMSAFLDYKDRTTCVLFGDGASAAIISHQGEGLSLDTVCLGADGELAELVIIPGGGSKNPASHKSVEEGLHYFKMTGKEVFKHAVRRMGAAAKECLEKAGLDESQMSWLIPHQANRRIMEAMAKNLNLSIEKVYQTVHKYGNTSSSSVAIALDELVQEHVLHEGEHLLLVAFGGGLTWGAALLTKIKG
jgi:3-oxoacyl-[acyl-carrier-protein] synthase III